MNDDITTPSESVGGVPTLPTGEATAGSASAVAVVTARSTSPSAAVTAITPDGIPNVLVVPLTITKRLTIRTVRSFLQTFVGLLGAGGFSAVVNPGASPLPLTTVQDVVFAAASGAAVAAGMSLATNLYILFKGLDESNPSLMA